MDAKRLRPTLLAMLIVILVAERISNSSANSPDNDALLVAPDLMIQVLGTLFNAHLLNEGINCSNQSLAKCLACRTALDLIVESQTLDNDQSTTDSEQLAIKICVEYNVTTAEQCTQMVKHSLPILLEKFSSQPGTLICSSLLVNCHCDALLPSRR